MIVDFDPVALQLGPLALHWYGLMYLAAFASGWWLGCFRAPRFAWRPDEVGDLVFYAVMGVIVGGRLGYVLFYDPATYLANPLQVFFLQRGGMSFHGGLLGVLLSMALYARKTGRSFFMVTDFVAPLIPPGLFFGRIGNFINGELWGAPTDLPWAMVFKTADALPRHPSMLYEALLEGVALLFVLVWFTRKPRPIMATSGMFLLGYGVFRFAVEFVRVPDIGLGYLFFDWVTMGQILSSPMIVLGAVFVTLAYRFNQFPPTSLAPLDVDALSATKVVAQSTAGNGPSAANAPRKTSKRNATKRKTERR